MVLAVLISSVGDFNDRDQGLPEASFDQRIHTQCKTDTSCYLNLTRQLKLGVDIEPKSLPVLTPLSIRIQPQLQDIDDFQITHAWFEGRDMDMGKHFLDIRATEDQVWLLNGMIPVCTVDRAMIWRLVIRYTLDGLLTELQIDLGASEHDAAAPV